jgi:hypothetical protein
MADISRKVVAQLYFEVFCEATWQKIDESSDHRSGFGYTQSAVDDLRRSTSLS